MGNPNSLAVLPVATQHGNPNGRPPDILFPTIVHTVTAPDEKGGCMDNPVEEHDMIIDLSDTRSGENDTGMCIDVQDNVMEGILLNASDGGKAMSTIGRDEGIGVMAINGGKPSFKDMVVGDLNVSNQNNLLGEKNPSTRVEKIEYKSPYGPWIQVSSRRTRLNSNRKLTSDAEITSGVESQMHGSRFASLAVVDEHVVSGLTKNARVHVNTGGKAKNGEFERLVRGKDVNLHRAESSRQGAGVGDQRPLKKVDYEKMEKKNHAKHVAGSNLDAGKHVAVRIVEKDGGHAISDNNGRSYVRPICKSGSEVANRFVTATNGLYRKGSMIKKGAGTGSMEKADTSDWIQTLTAELNQATVRECPERW
ncbi:hypothetical protein V6N12_058983 [Hibiscus sabdariffa]|uniref:Uncharacterized protein n=1 Tax=Hibiscus sabdariffa TaxID=183260 RepID=A0ABR2ETU2_9ROSI